MAIWNQRFQCLACSALTAQDEDGKKRAKLFDSMVMAGIYMSSSFPEDAMHLPAATLF